MRLADQLDATLSALDEKKRAPRHLRGQVEGLKAKAEIGAQQTERRRLRKKLEALSESGTSPL